MTPGLYKAHGGHMMMVVSIARKWVRVVRIQAGELQLRKETEDHIINDGYSLCAEPPLAVAIEKFLGHFGGVSETAKAALLNLKESIMDVKTATTKELVEFYNKHSDKPVKKFVNRETAETRVQVIVDELAKKTESKPAPAKDKAPKKEKASGESRRSSKDEFAGFPLTAKITVKDKSSPFREGSIRDTAFLGILKAKTVADARGVSKDPWHLRNAVSAGKVTVG